MNKNMLFTATVTAVYPKTVTQTVGGSQTIDRNAYTIDILPIVQGRAGYQNVPVVKPNSGGTQSGTGFIWLPGIGDLVICGFIEGYDLLPVCFGTINDASTQTLTLEGNTVNDCTLHHVSGSFIRMRGTSSPEIEIKHVRGTVIKIDADGNVTITGVGDTTLETSGNTSITAGGDVSVDSGGDTTIIAGGNVAIEAGGDAVITAAGKAHLSSPQVDLGEAAAEKLIKGDSFMAYFNTHLHPTGVGPSGPPASPMQSTLLSDITKTE